MSPALALSAVVVLVAAATLIGLLLRRRDGRARAAGGRAVSAQSLGVDPDSFGAAATLVQFSTELCSRCPAARRLLGAIAAEREGVTHVDVDVTHRPNIAKEFSVLQTPTVLLVDACGELRARFGGVPARGEVDAELDRIRELADA